MSSFNQLFYPTLAAVAAVDSTVKVLKAKVEELEDKLTNLVFLAKESVKKKGVDVSMFRTVITQLPAMSKVEFVPSTRYIETYCFIAKAKSIEEIFMLLSSRSCWDYLNYYLLMYIITKYGSDECNKLMKDYVKEVEQFRRDTKLCVFWQMHPKKLKDKPPGYEEITCQHRNNWSNLTLQDAEEFRLKLALEYSLHDYALMLYNVKFGCVVITWLIPASVVEPLKKAIQEKPPVELFNRYDITKMSIVGDVVYETDKLAQRKSCIVHDITWMDVLFHVITIHLSQVIEKLHQK